MSFTPWNTAHGEAAPMYLQVAATVPLSPADDSVDTNTVIIEGAGVILSFGDCSYIVLKRVKFQPLVLMSATEGDTRLPGSGAVITLENSNQLNLLSGQRRSINAEAYGMYFCPGNGEWNEVYFVQKGSATVTELDERLRALEDKIFGEK